VKLGNFKVFFLQTVLVRSVEKTVFFVIDKDSDSLFSDLSPISGQRCFDYERHYHRRSETYSIEAKQST